MEKIISCLVIAMTLVACSEEALLVQSDQESSIEMRGAVLTVTTDEASHILPFGAICGGEVSNSGGGNRVTERGVCFSTVENPTIDDETVPSGSGSGTFTSLLSWLDGGTTYYVRAYANKINKGTTTTTYGNEVSFTTPEPIYGTVVYNGFTYNTIEIGTQVWMIENLRTTTYNDGITPIPNVTDNTEWTNAIGGAYCDYDNNPANSDVYGRLYNSDAASNPDIAPSGWHVPSLGEFFTLADHLGVEFAGGRMKEAGFEHWDGPNTGADNSSGFNALGAGVRQVNGTFSNMNTQNRFWTSWTGYQMFILRYDSGTYGYAQGICSPPETCYKYGASVRLVKD
jgi:uncharacterized protein (TIGR02145 family)